jgi:hypothetical protein
VGGDVLEGTVALPPPGFSGAIPDFHITIPVCERALRLTGRSYNQETVSSGAHESFERELVVRGSSNRTLGMVFAVFFTLVGLWPLRHGRPARFWAVGIAALFLIVGLVAPALLGLLNRVWTRLGLVLHRITNPMILGFLFYGVFTPFGWVARTLFAKNFLRLKPDPAAASYWIERRPPGPPPESMTNQF